MDEKILENDINIKKIIKVVLIVFMVLITLFIFIINRRNGYIIIDESIIFTKNGSKLSQIKEIDKDVLKKKYMIHGKLGTKKNVTINYDNNRFYYFDKEYNDLNDTDVDLAYTKQFKKAKIADYKFSYYEKKDDSILKTVLNSNNISKFTDSVMKNSYDLDGDGTIEEIYTITNMLTVSNSNEHISSIFLARNGKFITRLNSDSISPYMVRSIIDIDGDGKYEVVVSKGTIDVTTFDTCFQVYKINKNKVKVLHDC